MHQTEILDLGSTQYFLSQYFQPLELLNFFSISSVSKQIKKNNKAKVTGDDIKYPINNMN